MWSDLESRGSDDAIGNRSVIDGTSMCLIGVVERRRGETIAGWNDRVARFRKHQQKQKALVFVTC
jgi:hypothetical protein